MQRKRRNVFWYFLSPIVLVWIITFAIQSVAELIYIAFHEVPFDRLLENEDILLDFMNQMAVFLNKYAAEFTTLIAICTIPFLVRMYQKDKSESAKWWEEKRKLKVKDILEIVILAICVCIAANVFILLSGITSRSETYIETAELIYHSLPMIQIVGLSIIVPIMEEMVYRGLLYRRMREYLPMTFSLIGSSLLFGIYHGNSVQLIYAAVIGCFLAYLFEMFRTLKSSILFHIAANVTSVICTWTGVFQLIFRNIISVTIVAVGTCMIACGILIVIKNES